MQVKNLDIDTSKRRAQVIQVSVNQSIKHGTEIKYDIGKCKSVSHGKEIKKLMKRP